MKHPTPEQLKPLLNAVDVACWALAVKEATKRGDRCRVNVKGALQDLREAWGMYELTQSEGEAVLSESKEYRCQEVNP